MIMEIVLCVSQANSCRRFGHVLTHKTFHLTSRKRVTVKLVNVFQNLCKHITFEPWTTTWNRRHNFLACIKWNWSYKNKPNYNRHVAAFWAGHLLSSVCFKLNNKWYGSNWKILKQTYQMIHSHAALFPLSPPFGQILGMCTVYSSQLPIVDFLGNGICLCWCLLFCFSIFNLDLWSAWLSFWGKTINQEIADILSPWEREHSVSPTLVTTPILKCLIQLFHLSGEGKWLLMLKGVMHKIES